MQCLVFTIENQADVVTNVVVVVVNEIVVVV